MDPQENGGGGKTTLYVVVFFLCVISAVVGYFQFTINSQQAEAEQMIKDIQAKAESEMAAAKSEEEKREIQRKAELESERVKLKAQSDEEKAKMKAQSDAEKAKMKAQSDAEKKALASREAKIKAAEAAVNKKMADAAARVRDAQNLQNQAKKVKADADKKKRDADAAMAKAVASGKAVDKKLANEKKKLAADAKKKVDAANAKAAKAAKAAQAEAKKALNYKNQLNQVTGRLSLIVSTVGQNNAVPGYLRGGYSGRVLGRGPDTSNPKVCRDWAAKEKFAVWGHRNNMHPDPKYKNTCFAYETATATYRGDANDKIHMVGCTYGDLRPDQTVCSRPKNFYRYVRIYRQRTYNDHWLNLAGVDIMSDGKNIAPTAKITASSVYPGTILRALVDGKMGTIAHTLNNPAEWFLFDLGTSKSIDRVVIWNRRDCCQARARGIQVQLSNDNKNWITGPKIRPERAGFWRHQWIPGETEYLSD
jgi:hypothetical protein